MCIDYAKALLNTNNPGDCIDVLNKTLILPQEGAAEGHEIYERANIELALNNIEAKKYKAAIKYLNQAKEFPENLGSGKPYDTDYRIEEYLLAFCEQKLGKKQKSLQSYQQIMDYSSDTEKFNNGNIANNYLSLIVLKKMGKEMEANELVKGWKHFEDSLNTWHISNAIQSPQMEWVLVKYNSPSASTSDLENRIVGIGNETRLGLLFRALKAVEEK